MKTLTNDQKTELTKAKDILQALTKEIEEYESNTGILLDQAIDALEEIDYNEVFDEDSDE